MGVGVSAIKYERENENESFRNDNTKVVMCDVTTLDRIRNECVRGSLGVTNVAGENARE